MIEASKSHGEAVLFASTNVADPVSAIAASTMKPANDPIANAHKRTWLRSHNFAISDDALTGSKFNFGSLGGASNQSG